MRWFAVMSSSLPTGVLDASEAEARGAGSQENKEARELGEVNEAREVKEVSAVPEVAEAALVVAVLAEAALVADDVYVYASLVLVVLCLVFLACPASFNLATTLSFRDCIPL